MPERPARPASGADALYPFLAGGELTWAAGSVAGRRVQSLPIERDMRQSTIEKAREIAALRARVLGEQQERLARCACAMARRFRSGSRLFAFGNGGSATDAQSVASLFLCPPWGQPLAALALPSAVAIVTALANDVGFEVVYARQIEAIGRDGDVAVGLSTSGNSPNVLRGLGEARRRGLLTVGFAGYEGGSMAASAEIDHLFVVPSPSVHRIQEAQTTLYHVLWELTQLALESGRDGGGHAPEEGGTADE